MHWDLEAWEAAKIGLAALLGGAVGLEREMHGRAAGLRTHLLVSTGSALIMSVSLHLGDQLGEKALAPGVRVDLAHLATGAITGIGFIGGGAILKDDNTVYGLTTAASIWVVSAIGMAVAANAFLLGVLVTGIALLALLVMGRMERFISQHYYYQLTVTYPLEAADLAGTLRQVEGHGLKILHAAPELDNAGRRMRYRLRLRGANALPHEEVDRLTRGLVGAESVRWE